MFNVGSQELLIILFVVLLLFGAKRIPEVARSFGKGMREFKKAMRGIENEFKLDLEDDPDSARKSAKARRERVGRAAGGVGAESKSPAETMSATVPLLLSPEGGRNVPNSGSSPLAPGNPTEPGDDAQAEGESPTPSPSLTPHRSPSPSPARHPQDAEAETS